MTENVLLTKTSKYNVALNKLNDTNNLNDDSEKTFDRYSALKENINAEIYIVKYLQLLLCKKYNIYRNCIII